MPNTGAHPSDNESQGNESPPRPRQSPEPFPPSTDQTASPHQHRLARVPSSGGAFGQRSASSPGFRFRIPRAALWTLAAALLLASVGLFASTAQALAETTLIKNLSQTHAPDLQVGTLDSSHFTVAVRFETGSHEGGYALTSVTINAENNIASDDSPRVSIYSAASGNDPAPNASVYTLTNPSSFGAGNLTFTAPADATLEKDTKYFVLIESAVSGGFYHVNGTTSNSVDSMTAGWS